MQTLCCSGHVSCSLPGLCLWRRLYAAAFPGYLQAGVRRWMWGPTEQSLSSGLATSQLCSFKQVFFKHLRVSVFSSIKWGHYCCSVTQTCPTLCDPMDCSMPGSPVLHYLLEFARIYVHWVSDAFQPSHPLYPPSPPAFSFSQYQCLFQCVSSLHQVAKVLEFQFQHQSSQWLFRVYFL